MFSRIVSSIIVLYFECFTGKETWIKFMIFIWEILELYIKSAIKIRKNCSAIIITNSPSIIRGSSLLIYSYHLKSESHLPQNLFYLYQWKPFKNDKKLFWFHLKSSFVLKIFSYLFALIFWSYGKKAWLTRKG